MKERKQAYTCKAFHFTNLVSNQSDLSFHLPLLRQQCLEVGVIIIFTDAANRSVRLPNRNRGSAHLFESSHNAFLWTHIWARRRLRILCSWPSSAKSLWLKSLHLEPLLKHQVPSASWTLPTKVEYRSIWWHSCLQITHLICKRLFATSPLLSCFLL